MRVVWTEQTAAWDLKTKGSYLVENYWMKKHQIVFDNICLLFNKMKIPKNFVRIVFSVSRSQRCGSTCWGRRSSPPPYPSLTTGQSVTRRMCRSFLVLKQNKRNQSKNRFIEKRKRGICCLFRKVQKTHTLHWIFIYIGYAWFSLVFYYSLTLMFVTSMPSKFFSWCQRVARGEKLLGPFLLWIL
jgi:hypothetical protein